MKSKLLILSDLWGFDDSTWIKEYIELLEADFELVCYDSCELAGIDKTDLTEEELHSQFLNGGIDKAVTRLLELEKDEVNVLAFSIGGTIAWKSALKGLKITHFFAVSSTRLRYESEKPNCFIQLIFGANDFFKPEQLWFENLNLQSIIIQKEAHDLYKKKVVISGLCRQIKFKNTWI